MTNESGCRGDARSTVLCTVDGALAVAKSWGTSVGEGDKDSVLAAGAGGGGTGSLLAWLATKGPMTELTGGGEDLTTGGAVLPSISSPPDVVLTGIVAA